MTRKMIILSCIVLFFAQCKKKDSAPVVSKPAATILDVSQDRSVSSSIFHFSVNLDKPAPNTVSIHYSTVASTAIAATDFISTSGTLTIATGSQFATIDVTVTGDSLRKTDQVFFVQLDNPQNCTLVNNKGTGIIQNKNSLYFPVSNTGYSTPDNYAGYSLAWSDEFDGSSIKDGNWAFETGNNNGWGNAELENYTNTTQNSFVSKGNLIIEARQEGNNYTSARMITKNKKIFKFGRIDIRAMLPKGKGVWPALWMLGNNIDAVSWPSCGEIDILELLGQEPNKIYGTMHWGASTATHASKGNSYVSASGSFDQQFHVYSIIWTQDNIKILVDDVQFVSFSSADVSGNYPFNSNFFFIFNIAVGGNWPGSPDNSTIFPQRMIVDYIRVFQ